MAGVVRGLRGGVGWGCYEVAQSAPELPPALYPHPSQAEHGNGHQQDIGGRGIGFGTRSKSRSCFLTQELKFFLICTI